MAAIGAIRDVLHDEALHDEAGPRMKDGDLGVALHDTYEGNDQDGLSFAPHASGGHPRASARGHPPRLDAASRDSRASSLADDALALALPEPLGPAELSPVPAARRAGRPGAPSERAGSMRSSAGGGAPRARGRHLALLGPSRPAPTKIWKRRFLKLLIVGDSGLGKTTLISSLLNNAHETVAVHDGTGTSLTEFKNDPESLVTTISWKDEEAREVWLVRVQDTPGYGDWENIQVHIDMIKGFVERQNRKWLEMESARDRLLDMSDVDDPRIDVCLYAMPPHRLRQNDVRYMSQLGKLVPIVPVVLKADTMTISESQRFRQEVAARLSNPDTRGVKGRINTFLFSPQALQRAGQDPGSPACAYPFIVVASNDVNQGMLRADQPVFWPQRAYKWGTAEAFNSAHSDLLALRALLLSEGLEEMVAAKRSRYEEWRRAALRVPLLARLRRRAARLALLTLAPAAGAVFAAAHGFDKARMRGALEGAWRDAAARRGARRGTGAPRVVAWQESPAPAAPAAAAGGAAPAATAPPREQQQAPRAAGRPQQKRGWF
ncbi:MAG: Septin-domain-containing protein [Monoraphidium minutum]|nr:MAG: Septin-domain-containing protein [Monoraphidium minutum]